MSTNHSCFGKWKTRIALAAAAGAALSGASCAEHDPKPARLDVAPVATATNPELDRLRKLQAIHRIDTDPSGTTAEVEVPAWWVTFDMSGACDIELNTVPASANACENDFRLNVLEPLCVSRGLLALATPQSSPITISYPNPGGGAYTKTFPNVSEPQAAILATYAVDFARDAMAKAITQLTTPSTACRNASGIWTKSTEGRTLSLEYASSFANGYYLGEKAYDRAIEATVNAADALASSTASERQAAAES